jgi:hypothetical protein
MNTDLDLAVEEIPEDSMEDDSWEKGFLPDEIEMPPSLTWAEMAEKRAKAKAEYQAWESEQIIREKHEAQDLNWHREQEVIRRERDADYAMNGYQW